MKEKALKLIYDARRAKDLTQGVLAEKLGVSEVTYSKMENGHNVSSHLIWDAMDYLGIKTIE